jgi:hypothetical protein
MAELQEAPNQGSRALSAQQHPIYAAPWTMHRVTLRTLMSVDRLYPRCSWSPA